MEMNTRIQVEHTVTEEVYGCDLVKEQIRIAAGEHLSPHIRNAKPHGHAVQCRINAEDPLKNFQPSPGKITFYYAPGGRGVRIDSHAYTGYVVPPHYDSMIAKLITVAATRLSAIDRMRRALDEYYITGIKTTVAFHSAIMRNAEFREGKFDTGFIERVMSDKNFEIRVAPTRLHE
jgi:acetyl-CoA carboxylase biotin carboxylase subunit